MSVAKRSSDTKHGIISSCLDATTLSLLLLKHLIISAQVLDDFLNIGFQLWQMCFDGLADGVAEFNEGRGFVSDDRVFLVVINRVEVFIILL